VSDPSTDTWHETMGLSTSAQLRQTQTALSAFQADLTHVERQLREAEAERLVAEARLHDALNDCDALRLLWDEAANEARVMRKAAESRPPFAGDIGLSGIFGHPIYSDLLRLHSTTQPTKSIGRSRHYARPWTGVNTWKSATRKNPLHDQRRTQNPGGWHISLFTNHPSLITALILCQF